MVEEDFIRAEFHCGWRAVERPDGYTFVNLKGQVMPHRFWKVSDFDEETGVAQVEFMKGGKGCVTFDARILPLPFDGELVDKLTKDKSVYKVHLPNKRTIYTIYDAKTRKRSKGFAEWKVVKNYKDGSMLVRVAKNTFQIFEDGRPTLAIFRDMKVTSLGILLEERPSSWMLQRDENPASIELFYVDHEDEKGKYLVGQTGKYLLSKDGEMTPCDFELSYDNAKTNNSKTNEDVLLRGANITVHTKKPSQKYHKVTLDIEGKTYSLEELGEDIKVSDVYKNSTTRKIYLYGAHTGEELTWWTLDQDGNVDKLSDVCEYGYDKDGSIVSKGKTMIFKARDIENQNAKTL